MMNNTIPRNRQFRISRVCGWRQRRLKGGANRHAMRRTGVKPGEGAAHGPGAAQSTMR